MNDADPMAVNGGIDDLPEKVPGLAFVEAAVADDQVVQVLTRLHEFGDDDERIRHVERFY